MNSKKTARPTTQGSFEIASVLIVTFTMSFIILCLYSLATMQLHNSISFHAGNQAFFEAKGILLETYQNIRSNKDWPIFINNRYSDLIERNKISSYRTIEKNEEDIKITVDTVVRNNKRRIIGLYSRDSAVDESIKNNYYLAMDNSSSMDNDSDTLPAAKSAVISFLDNSILSHSPTGLLGFAGNVKFQFQVSDNIELINEMKLKINSLQNSSLSDGTNYEAALKATRSSLQSYGSTSPNVIILFTDGLPTLADSCGGNCTGCSNSSSEYLPNNIGTCCSDAAIKYAQSIKNTTNTKIYTVLLYNDSFDSCRKNLATQTLISISSEVDKSKANYSNRDFYIETNDAANLGPIFEKILDTTGVIESFSINEAIP